MHSKHLMKFVQVSLLIFISSIEFISAQNNNEEFKLEIGMPNVCVVEKQSLRRVKRSLIRPVKKLEKVWKANCRFLGDWCLIEEEKTELEEFFQNDVQVTPQVVLECCKGSVQLKGYRGCLPESSCAPQVRKMCKNGGICYQQGYSALCVCPSGFTGQLCDNDVDECQDSNGGCQNECCNVDGGHFCKCAPGYTLSSDGKSCLDIDECSYFNRSGCSHFCINLPGGFRCDCPKGYSVDTDKLTCVQEYKHPCDKPDRGGCQQICEKLFDNGFVCSCNKGYQLNLDRRSCKLKDACLTDNGGCSQLCESTDDVNGARCLCRSGYQVNTLDPRQCKDIDECRINNGGCQHTCSNVPGSFVCDCFPGWLLGADSRSCYKINMQLTDPCQYANGGCAHKCTWDSSQTQAVCSCFNGYQLAQDSKSCVDFDECTQSPHQCTPPAICNNEIGSYSCICPIGYQSDPSNRMACRDINECLNYKGGCEYSCVNTEGSYFCVCAIGYQLSSTNNKTCLPINQQPSDENSQKIEPSLDGNKCVQGTFGDKCQYKCYHCQNGGRCDPTQTSCQCPEYFVGMLCQINCMKHSEHKLCHGKWLCSCKNGGRCSLNSSNQMECLCPEGYYGRDCQHSTMKPVPPTSDQMCLEGYYGRDCQLQCPALHLCHSRHCHRLTGKCLCSPGLYGPTCHLKCPPGTWGPSCSMLCRCFTRGNNHPQNACNPKTGECLCKAGYTGPACLEKCPPGFFGDGCVNSCPRDQCPTSCDEITGLCGSNQHLYPADCPEGLPCRTQQSQTNLCTTKQCVVTNTRACTDQDQCVCRAGFTGTLCQLKCSSGYYGDGCTNKCKCQLDSFCNHINGSCSCYNCHNVCPMGKWGDTCEKDCLCEVKSSTGCNQYNAKCLCLPGYQGVACESKCPAGYFGDGCIHTCRCNQGQCDHVSGACKCLAGWHGDRCELQCPPGYYGPGCTSKCKCYTDTLTTLLSACDPVSGKCLCPLGRIGRMCEQECSMGYYGANCSRACRCHQLTASNGSKEGTEQCDTSTGRCLCRAGWYGATCAQKCLPGFYGKGCSLTCQCLHGANCHHVDGTCQCPLGRYGDVCEFECRPGFWGPRCSLPCSARCPSMCDAVNGKCVPCSTDPYGSSSCQPQYKYSSSDSQRVVGLPECSIEANAAGNAVTCPNQCKCRAPLICESGRCTCPPGRSNYPECSSSCPFSYWGKECRQLCKCFNGEPCHPITGRCFCLAGYFGPYCSTICPPGKYGPSCALKCPPCSSPTQRCHPQTGQCSCPPGRSGPSCSQVCPQGRYGPLCSQACLCHPTNTQSCHSSTGQCTCKPGYFGPLCQQPCPPGFYGPACQRQCIKQCYNNIPCNPVTGHCLCPPHLLGERCQHELNMIQRILRL